MKSTSLLFGAIALALAGTAAQAADAAAAGETFEQKCGRWADYQSLKDNSRAEYVTDCMRELHHPEKPAEGDDD